MDEFELFYEYLEKSKNIREFCEKNEGLLLQCVRTDRFTDDEKIHFLNIVGSEIEKLIVYIDELKKEKLKKCKKKPASPASLGNGIPIKEVVQNLKKLRNIKLA